MAKLFDGVCTNPKCEQAGEVVETWADSIDTESQELIGAVCETCRKKLQRVLTPININTAPKSNSGSQDIIRYYDIAAAAFVPRVGTVIVTKDPTITNQEGPFKIGEVFDVKKGKSN